MLTINRRDKNMKTLNQATKQILNDSLKVSSEEMREVYNSEYGYNGLSPKTCRDYLQGLPSSCTVPFYNFDIIKTLSSLGIERKTEKGRDNLIDKYWDYVGYQLYKLIK